MLAKGTTAGRHALAFMAGMVLATPKANSITDASSAQSCAIVKKFTSVVSRVTAEGTLILDDGSEVVLSGILMPRDRDAGDGHASWLPAREANQFLTQLVVGKAVTVAGGSGDADRDRFGRPIAHVLVDGPSGPPQWVQGAILAAGHARAVALPARTSCLTEAIAHERAALDQRIGLWNYGLYRMRRADRMAALMARRGTFQIVEGTIQKVSTQARMTYLNFGPNWRDDFSIGVPAALAKDNEEWTKTLAALAGRRVRVRGYIERRNGPFITLHHPAQMEILNNASAAPEQPGGYKRDRPEAETSGRF